MLDQCPLAGGANMAVDTCRTHKAVPSAIDGLSVNQAKLRND